MEQQRNIHVFRGQENTEVQVGYFKLLQRRPQPQEGYKIQKMLNDSSVAPYTDGQDK